MELLASNQPWNLIIYMAIPVILAETLAIAELYLLFTRNFGGTVKKISKWAGILAGIYFLGIFLYLFKTAYIPITMGGEWRGFADVIAVSFYLLGVVPLMGICLNELGIINSKKDDEGKLRSHAILVAIFLVVAHIAMIFGMINPSIFSTSPSTMPTNMGQH
jgi:hypothetical protein